jgi:hypothetical protein
MRTRLLGWAALLGLALLPAAARPDEGKEAKTDKADKPDKPTVIVRLAPIDRLTADLGYLAELAGKEDVPKQITTLVKRLTGPDGLKGVDTKRALGLYATIGPVGLDSKAVALIPVADEQAFLATVKKLAGSDPKKEEDGSYSLELPDGRIPPLYFRFVKKYCYLTIQDKEAIDKEQLLEPAEVLAADKVGLLSVTVNIDRIPANLKQLALGQVDLRLAKLGDEMVEGETKAQAQFRKAVLNDVSARIKSVLREGGPVEVRLDLDRQAGDLTFSASLAGKAKTKLAEAIAELGKVRSLAASLAGEDSALSVYLDAALPAKVRAALAPVIDEGEKKALTEAKNRGRRELLAAVAPAIKPTLKGGELDGGLDLRGPGAGGIYTAIAGIKVQDAATIDKTLRKLAGDLPPEQRDLIKLDFDKVGAVSIHRLKPARVEKETQEILGDNPIFLAIREDALFLAGGEKGLEALKEALGTAPKPGRIAQAELAAARVAPLLEKENKGAVEAAKKAFGNDKDSDRVRVTVEGGDALRLRLAVKTGLVKFLGLLDAQKGDQ